MCECIFHFGKLAPSQDETAFAGIDYGTLSVHADVGDVDGGWQRFIAPPPSPPVVLMNSVCSVCNRATPFNFQQVMFQKS